MVQPKSVRQVMPIPETSGNCGVSLPRIPVVQRSVRGVDCPSMLKPDNVKDNQVATSDCPLRNRPASRLRVHRIVMRLLLQDGPGQIQVLHHLMAHPVARPMDGPKVRPRGIASSADPNTMPIPAPNTSP